MNWFAKTKEAPQKDSPEGGGVERTYRPNRPASKVLVVCLSLFVGVSVAISMFAPRDPKGDRYIVVALFAVMALCDAALILAIRLFPFLFRTPLDEARIRERVITLRRNWTQRHELWLGDVTRMVWSLDEGRAQVHLFWQDGKLTVPVNTLKRADSVELIEWLRWGTPVDSENWPRFCHLVALPRRGAIDRPLRVGEWRRTRRAFDRVMVVVAVVLAVLVGIGMFWSDSMRWLTVLWMIPSLWMWRFTIPKEGEIVWRAPRMPHYYKFIAAIWAAIGVCAGELAMRGDHMSDVDAYVFLTAMIAAIALTALFWRQKNRFIAEHEPRWIANSVIAWDAEAKSGAWALGRERR